MLIKKKFSIEGKSVSLQKKYIQGELHFHPFHKLSSNYVIEKLHSSNLGLS